MILPLLAAAAVHAAAPANAGIPLSLIDTDLNARTITLVSLTTAARGDAAPGLEFLDAKGQRQSLPLASVLALLPQDLPAHAARASADASAAVLPRLELADGQRLAGALAPATAPDAASPAVKWLSPRLGTLSIPLDLVTRYVGAPDRLRTITSGQPLSAAGDTVVLLSGDRVEGILDHLGSTIIISPPLSADRNAPAASEPTRIPADQAALVNLFTRRSPATGSRLTLADGSVLAAATLTFDQSGLSFTPALRPSDALVKPVRLSPAEFLSFTPDAGAFVPLSSIPIAAQSIHPSRAFGENVRIDDADHAPAGLQDVLLPGPMTVEWTLPAGASAFATTLQLPPDALTWGDCTVTVAAVGPGAQARTLDQARLNADAPSHAVRVALEKGDRLRISIDPGERGPVQDRVVLRRALVRLAPAPAQR